MDSYIGISRPRTGAHGARNLPISIAAIFHLKAGAVRDEAISRTGWGPT